MAEHERFQIELLRITFGISILLRCTFRAKDARGKELSVHDINYTFVVASPPLQE
jgi:hypothetical protein